MLGAAVWPLSRAFIRGTGISRVTSFRTRDFTIGSKWTVEKENEKKNLSRDGFCDRHAFFWIILLIILSSSSRTTVAAASRLTRRRRAFAIILLLSNAGRFIVQKQNTICSNTVRALRTIIYIHISAWRDYCYTYPRTATRNYYFNVHTRVICYYVNESAYVFVCVREHLYRRYIIKRVRVKLCYLQHWSFEMCQGLQIGRYANAVYNGDAY